jgi:hypothetical protein
LGNDNPYQKRIWATSGGHNINYIPGPQHPGAFPAIPREPFFVLWARRIFFESLRPPPVISRRFEQLIQTEAIKERRIAPLHNYNMLLVLFVWYSIADRRQRKPLALATTAGRSESC